MIIMKFGGTSLGSADAIRNACDIVQRSLDRQPVLVVSAHSGVTNELTALSKRAPDGDIDCSRVIERHHQLLRDLDLPIGLLDDLFDELQDLVRGMKLVGEASLRAVDYLLAFGERCSSRTIAASLTKAGIKATAANAYDIGLRTDSNFSRAMPLPDDGRIKTKITAIEGVPVITGFIAQDEQGNVTTLGRNGSDFSAALFGHALDVDEIQIWTDVDGVMTADPSIVKNAQRIEAMSFEEASELAYYGGKVLHPSTILPAMAKSIPVRVLNTHRCESPGTLVLPSLPDDGSTVRSVVYKEGIYLVNIVTPRMLQQSGYLARVFGLAAQHEVDVDLVATSEVSITMTTDKANRLDGFRRDLSELGEVTVEDKQALISVVGQGIASSGGVAARVLGTLSREDVRVRVISQGAIKVNVALIIAESEVERAVKALHDDFFPT